MTQKLILPINQAKLTASMKTNEYLTKFGFIHYGVDMVSSAGDRSIWASADGTVVATGYDNVVGNVVAVLYRDAYNRISRNVQDIVFRYFHLESIAVKIGQEVSKDTKLGVYGNTGQYSTGAHLHLEADTDTEHPLYSPTVSSSNFLKGSAVGANDTTMNNPLDWLFRKTDAPDYQSWTTAGDSFIKDGDKSIPELTGTIGQSNIRIEGIDVSTHNGEINWPQVKASGKEFAFIRLGWAGWDGRIEGNGGLDNRFHENVKGAINAGLHVGVYIYSYCKTPDAAVTAAREALELVKPYKLDYPIAFDIEDVSDNGVRYDKMNKKDNSAIANAFLAELEKAGYLGILYTYKSFAENYLDMSALSKWDTWIAHYANVCAYGGAYTIWQYKGDIQGFTGTCGGVNTACDLNVSYKDYAAFISEHSLNKPGTLASGKQDNLASILTELSSLRTQLESLEERVSKL